MKLNQTNLDDKSQAIFETHRVGWLSAGSTMFNSLSWNCQPAAEVSWLMVFHVLMLWHDVVTGANDSMMALELAFEMEPTSGSAHTCVPGLHKLF